MSHKDRYRSFFGQEGIVAIIGASEKRIYTYPNTTISVLKKQGYEVHAVTLHGRDITIPLNKTETEQIPTEKEFPRNLDFLVLYVTPKLKIPENIGIVIPPQTNVLINENKYKILRECPILALGFHPSDFGI